MERICEPELMEGTEQAQAYAAADFASGDQAMVDRLWERHGPALGEAILDLGCGPGNITFRLADRCPGARVLGVDGSAAMLAIAEQRRLQEERWRRSVAFLREELPCPSLAGRRFNALVSNSLLHHLHDPQRLWRSVAGLAAPGAVVYVQDLRRPADEEELEALDRLHGVGLDPHVRRDYRHSLRAAFTPQEVAAQLIEAGLPHLAVQPLDDQYLVVEGRLPGRLAG